MRNNPELSDIELSDLGATSLVTLYCRAREASKSGSLLDDPLARDLTRLLDPLLASSESPLYRSLARGQLDPRLAVYVAMRARRFDAYVREFRQRCPDGYVVNMGCGFDTRFHRIGDREVLFFDLDRSDVIRNKRQLLSETERYRFVESSVLDRSWMEHLPRPAVPGLFLAEGLFMYLREQEVRTLVLDLRDRAPGSELVAEVFNRRWLHPWIKWMVDLKLQRTLGFGSGAAFRSGLADSREMSRWGPGIEFVDDWSVFDEDEPRLGVSRYLRYWNLIRCVEWVVHYRFPRN